MAQLKVGWVGLGRMGIPMSKNLLNAGYPVTVYNRTKEKTKELADIGADVADSPKEVAEKCDVVISMISSDTALKAVFIGEEGVVKGVKESTILVDMSTVSPEASAEVNEAAEAKGCKFLRAPVTGSTALAEAGTLGILCSGDKKAYDKVLELFEVMGKNQFYLGDGEEARYMKLVLNMMIGTSCQMLAESLVFGKKAGLDWAQMLEIIAGSAVGSPLFNYKKAPLTERKFEAAFTSAMMEKDFDLVYDIAQKENLCLPVTALTRQFLASLSAKGMGNKDFSALLLLMEEMCGIKN
ncbi:MAG: hypothetical protein PWQ96_1641 [Clostridia bacterium]|nr:hypothetical protein [Clostridia bacterium]